MDGNNLFPLVKRKQTNAELEALKKLKLNSPRMKFRFRLEAFRFALYVFWPITIVWIFNSPFFQQKSEEFIQRFGRQFGITEEFIRSNSQRMKEFKQQVTEGKQREEYAKLLHEQMEFESARRFREKYGL
ncbi:hypothetical protein niasHS_002673 [Heterodera schachtii]|uniref:Uncharacterized protein n=1 Tax=Heterodera schachtii TaxID=97005 RepID=A0ABD2K259_HETSC